MKRILKMRKMKRILTLVCVVAVVAAFGSAAKAVDISTVSVDNSGNTADDTNYGSVAYDYKIGKYEVTAGQYRDFLNAVAATDVYGLYNASMNSSIAGCQITQIGVSGAFTYDFSGRPSGTESDWENRPVNFVGWGDAARFANWLHNGQPTGPQDLDTTEDGAYYLNGATSDAALMAVSRESDWKWAITNENEWYKAAYYDPNMNSGAGGYYDYPTRSDAVPSNVLNGNGNNATFKNGGFTIGSPYYRTEAGAHVNSESPYDTFDQGGNVWEWTEGVVDNSFHAIRGGSLNSPDIATHLEASSRTGVAPSQENVDYGFRVSQFVESAPVSPEPGTMALLALGAAGMLMRRKGAKK